MIKLTDVAIQKFKEISEAEGRKEHGLRVIVRDGGSQQPQFALNFVAPEEVAAEDKTFESNGVKVYLDPESVKWLEDATVDFVDEIQESGFKVDAPNAGVKAPTGPVADAVVKVLEDKINPAVASHGGFVSLVAIENETAYLRFGGGCQGCGMINVTLKQGVERTLFEAVPQITRVMDVTDHASGTNPYYQPGK